LRLTILEYNAGMEQLTDVRRGFFGKIAEKIKKLVRFAWLLLQYLFDRSLDALARDLVIMQREADLFLGAALSLVGLLGFESARYCDGNLNDYISCTRPATYYYFDTLDTVLIVLGIFCMLVWYFKHKERTARPVSKRN
jgi:hypothetical protein